MVPLKSGNQLPGLKPTCVLVPYTPSSQPSHGGHSTCLRASYSGPNISWLMSPVLKRLVSKRLRIQIFLQERGGWGWQNGNDREFSHIPDTRNLDTERNICTRLFYYRPHKLSTLVLYNPNLCHIRIPRHFSLRLSPFWKRFYRHLRITTTVGCIYHTCIHETDRKEALGKRAGEKNTHKLL